MQNDPRNYYTILGVEPTADVDQIKSAFRALARQYHPDVRPEDEEAATEFKKINEAYEVLSDPAKRRQYDQLRAHRARKADDLAPPVWPTDLMAGFGAPPGLRQRDWFWEELHHFLDAWFEGHDIREPRPAQSRRPDLDVQAELPLAPEEAAQGGVCHFTLNLQEPCPECDGRGVLMGWGCPGCYGRGAIRQRRPIEVEIPPGVRNGSVLRVAGEGKSHPGTAARGDLYLHVRVRPGW